MTNPTIVFRALGTPELHSPEAQLQSVLSRPKLLGLLSFLACASPRGFHRRDTLLGLFWAETDQGRARRALRQSLYYLRQSLGADVVMGRGEEELGLDGDRLWCDVTAFETALDEGRTEEGLELYRGDLLEGFFVSGAPEYERWLDERRDELRRRAGAAAWSLAERAGADGNDAGAGHWAHRAAALAPFDEHVTRQAIHLLDRIGDRSGALLLYGSFARRLEQELEIVPAPETQALVARIRERTEAPAHEADAEAVSKTDALLDRVEDQHETADPLARETPIESAAGPRSAVPVRGRGLRVGLVAGLAIGFVLVMFWRSGSAGPSLDPQRVAVAVFDNQTGDPDLDPLGRMAADWITQALHESRLIDVVPSTIGLSPRPDFAAREPLAAAALAEETGAGTIVAGAFYRRGDSVEIQAQIIDATDGDLLSAVAPVGGPLDAPGAVVESLSRSVVRTLAVLADASLARSADVSHPPSLDAYREYLEGFRTFQRVPPEMREALSHFYRAVELDSTFLAPRFYIVMAHANLNEVATADSNASVLAGMSPMLSESQRHTLDWMVTQLRGDQTGALEAARARGGIDVGVQALKVNRPSEAIAALSPVDLSPHYFQWLALTEAYHGVGDFQRELDEARRGREVYPARLRMLDAELRALAALGHVEEAKRVLDESLSLSLEEDVTPAILMGNLSAELRAHGHVAAGAEIADRAVEWLQSHSPDERESWPQRYAMARAFYQAAQWEESRALLSELASERPDHIDVLGYLGALAARRADRQSALSIAEDLAGMALPPDFGRDSYRRAGIASLLGDREGAIALLRAGVAAGWAYDVVLHRDVDLEPLRGYPPFEEFTRPKG